MKEQRLAEQMKNTSYAKRGAKAIQFARFKGEYRYRCIDSKIKPAGTNKTVRIAPRAVVSECCVVGIFDYWYGLIYFLMCLDSRLWLGDRASVSVRVFWLAHLVPSK